MIKFGRTFTLSIWEKAVFKDGEVGVQANTTKPSLVISLPFTVDFDISRENLAQSNHAKIRVYNLSAEHRNFLRFDQSNTGQIQQIQFNAGYGSNPPMVFTGNLRQAFSVREGVNFISELIAFDNGYAAVNAIFDGYFAPGTPWVDVLTTIAMSIPNVSIGSVGSFPGTLPRPQTYSGNPIDLLSELTGGASFIDNGKVNILGTAECIATANPVVINAQSGLLNTPQLEVGIASFSMLFEPSLHLGEVVDVVSATGSNFNGTFKIIGVKHRGTISGAVCGEAITTGTFAYSQKLTEVAQVQQ